MNDNPRAKRGSVAVVGRPNVGKSTFLNAVLRQKISITCRKPQTTRHQIIGVKTLGDAQIVFIDTPGLQMHPRNQLNRYMNRQSTRILPEVDVALFMVEAARWLPEDANVLKAIADAKVCSILVPNKIDRVSDKRRLLPYLEEISAYHEFREVVPISARDESNFERLQACILALLPHGLHWFPDDQVTDKSERFLAAEIIREKLIRRLGDEIPYVLAVTVPEFAVSESLIRIHAVIWVQNQGQKAIVIGRGGRVLKDSGSAARVELEEMLQHKVFLETWVKVKENWSDNAVALAELGYTG